MTNTIDKSITTEELKSSIDLLSKSNVKISSLDNIYVLIKGIPHLVYHEGKKIHKSSKHIEKEVGIVLRAIFDDDVHNKLLAIATGNDGDLGN